MKPEENQRDTNLYHDDVPEMVRYRPSRRGELNTLRKGISKIHRRYTPVFNGLIPQGIAGRVCASITRHDWNRNSALIALRQRGYTPWSRQFDPDFKPRPLRIGVRSESREALTALHFALAANCDYNPDNEYPFEVIVPFEEIARQMGVLHRYENGRVAYDIALHALRVTEEMKQVYVVRGFDKDTRQHKPLRIFLNVDFFTSKGLNLDELKTLVCRFQAWTRKKGLTQSMKQRNERHLLRLARLNLGIDKLYSLKKLLKRVKWQITSPALIEEKNKIIHDIEEAIDNKVSAMPVTKSSAKTNWFAFSAITPVFITRKIEDAVNSEMPGLRVTDEDRYYSLLLERAGQSS
ncbi:MULTISPECIES: hypothetical protein [Enterobacteriaceae]|uniref:hypothetical protein n=1 Tax=Enterobacteriaceae TaxID=543 RepID=UPI0023F660CA|nr:MULTISPECIES: hypothetical protein [Enterobacteriaceae]MDF6026508.1 hypothetical protein [Escherichia coli]MEA8884808.1 hypothetical protein [Citrobacter freundii]HAW7121017.1 hypothetical protein [Citrobacter freundii]HAW7138758.1 hypothetical protein [Citrobacter freundii]HAW7143784.1 hypothetical protein [Citrobacter freundii]